MKEGKRVLFTAVALVVLFSGCKSTKPKAKVTSSAGPTMEQAQAVPYNGPKARIAVKNFENKTGRWYEGEIGRGMAEMLATALFHTNRFIVLEREMISAVLEEQDFGITERIRKETRIAGGEIEGAELLVTGAVTEFEPGSSGGGGKVIGGHWGYVSGGPRISFQKAHVAIDIRVYDTRTSRIVAACSVEGKAKNIGLGGVVFSPYVDVDLGGWSKTPMEKAVRVAIAEAVNYIVQNTPKEYFHYEERKSSNTGGEQSSQKAKIKDDLIVP